MNRRDFEALRALPGKYILDDIVFKAERGMGPSLVFRNIRVFNAMNLGVFLNGTFKPRLNAITYNFVLSGTGPICRIDVNSTIHGEAGRTHKHELESETDPLYNLPNAIIIRDLGEPTPLAVWKRVCTGANIEHRGRFVEPVDER